MSSVRRQNWNKNKSDLIDKQFKLEEYFTFLERPIS